LKLSWYELVDLSDSKTPQQFLKKWFGFKKKLRNNIFLKKILRLWNIGSIQVSQLNPPNL
jgi:hypothetical protein